ncbi:hypothetical protein [Hyphococcus sp.]|uniref:hypothetical protein n=1 Tax=Hyphococcus sp. TaxID=2038636 RepID=UPI0035C69D77
MQKETQFKTIKRRASDLEYLNNKADAASREEAVSRAIDFALKLCERGSPGFAIELLDLMKNGLNSGRACK